MKFIEFQSFYKAKTLQIQSLLVMRVKYSELEFEKHLTMAKCGHKVNILHTPARANEYLMLLDIVFQLRKFCKKPVLQRTSG